jgi:hypothetical protein
VTGGFTLVSVPVCRGNGVAATGARTVAEEADALGGLEPVADDVDAGSVSTGTGRMGATLGAESAGARGGALEDNARERERTTPTTSASNIARPTTAASPTARLLAFTISRPAADTEVLDS